jgi:hypothetical protein
MRHREAPSWPAKQLCRARGMVHIARVLAPRGLFVWPHGE